MLKDAAWSLAAIACLLVTLYSVHLGVTAWREFDKDEPIFRPGFHNYGKREAKQRYRADATNGARAHSEPSALVNDQTNFTNKSPEDDDEIPDAPLDDSEDVTDIPEGTGSSPYLFQPIRYMNKEKRSFYKEFKDGSSQIAR